MLTSLLWALLRCGGQLSISRLHRWLVREHDWLVDQTGEMSRKAISHSQLRRVLADLDYTRYNGLSEEFFGWSAQVEGVWRSVDGKELRGSINGVSGQKRGEVLVRLVGHEDALAQVLGFYQGQKESERTLVEEYIQAQSTGSLQGECWSLDALFATPALLRALQEAGVNYVVGLKANQAELLTQAQALREGEAHFDWAQLEKGHGRVEQRHYQGYELPLWQVDARWDRSGLVSIVWVERNRFRTKDGKTTQESCCFVSNVNLEGLGGLVLAGAIRNHWRIESDHYVRDTTAGEDGIRCGHGNRLRSVASVLNVGLNLLRAADRKGNLRAYWEDCSADRQNVVDSWRRT